MREVLTAVVALCAAAGCSNPTSNQSKDVRTWFAENGVSLGDDDIRCASLEDDYACQVSIAKVGRVQVLVKERGETRTMTLANARWGASVEKLVARDFMTVFAGAVMEELTCPSVVITQPTTCTGRFEGAAVSVRFVPRFGADAAAIGELELVNGLVTADKLEAAARELAVTTRAGDLSFKCDRRVYGFGRQVRCSALNPELNDGPSLAAEFMIAADGKLSSRIVKLTDGAPWTPVPR